MGTPAGFYRWAKARGASPFHPDLWSSADHAAYHAWQRELFIDKMRTFKAFGQWDLMGNIQARTRIREWLDTLRAPVPSRPFLRCDCCAPRFVKTKPQPEPAHGMVYLESFRRKAPR